MEFDSIAVEPTGFDALIKFEGFLDEAEETGLVVGIPENSERFDKLKLSQDIFPLVWDRLYRLGYLATQKPNRSLGRSRLRKALKRAVKKLQKEAGLTVDGWLGLQTWDALQELFSFEQQTELTRWTNNSSRRFLNRALELRLVTLGIIRDGETRVTGRDITDALANWRDFLSRLTDTNIDLDSPEAEVYQWLFDIDALTRLVATNFATINEIQATSPQCEFVFRFVKCLLKIELWLYGFDGIKPGRHGGIQTFSFNPAALRRQKNEGAKTTLNSSSIALTELCLEAKLSVTETDSEIQLVEQSLMFFADLDDRARSQEKAKTEVDSLNEQMNGLKKNEQRQIVSLVKKKTGLGARIFDGIKRMFQWLRNMVSKAIDWVRTKSAC